MQCASRLTHACGWRGWVPSRGVWKQEGGPQGCLTSLIWILGAGALKNARGRAGRYALFGRRRLEARAACLVVLATPRVCRSAGASRALVARPLFPAWPLFAAAPLAPAGYRCRSWLQPARPNSSRVNFGTLSRLADVLPSWFDWTRLGAWLVLSLRDCMRVPGSQQTVPKSCDGAG